MVDHRRKPRVVGHEDAIGVEDPERHDLRIIGDSVHADVVLVGGDDAGHKGAVAKRIGHVRGVVDEVEAIGRDAAGEFRVGDVEARIDDRDDHALAGEPTLVRDVGIDQPQPLLGVVFIGLEWRRRRRRRGSSGGVSVAIATATGAAGDRGDTAARGAHAREHGDDRRDGRPHRGNDLDIAAGCGGRGDDLLGEVGIQLGCFVDDLLGQFRIRLCCGRDGFEQRVVALGGGVG